MRTTREIWIITSFVLWAGRAWAAPAHYALDARESRVVFEAQSRLHPFSGATTNVSGSMEADWTAGVLAGPAEVRVSLAQFETGHGARDRAVRATLDADKHPEAVFRVKEAAPAAGEGLYLLTGDLELAGVSRPVRFEVRAVKTDDGILAEGSAPIRIDAFQLKVPGLARLIGIRPEVTVRFRALWREAA